MMPFEHAADDFEPLDVSERCEAAYGPYHIGRCDESRDEIALMFDTRWHHPLDRTRTLIEELLTIAMDFDVNLQAWGRYVSPVRSDHTLYAALRDQLCAARPFDRVIARRLFVVRLDTATNGTWELNRRLRLLKSYVGYADLSYPTTLRTLATEILMSAWQLAYEHRDEPAHWIHTVRH